jgi:hypothetical protein
MKKTKINGNGMYMTITLIALTYMKFITNDYFKIFYYTIFTFLYITSILYILLLSANDKIWYKIKIRHVIFGYNFAIFLTLKQFFTLEKSINTFFIITIIIYLTFLKYNYNTTNDRIFLWYQLKHYKNYISLFKFLYTKEYFELYNMKVEYNSNYLHTFKAPKIDFTLNYDKYDQELKELINKEDIDIEDYIINPTLFYKNSDNYNDEVIDTYKVYNTSFFDKNLENNVYIQDPAFKIINFCNADKFFKFIKSTTPNQKVKDTKIELLKDIDIKLLKYSLIFVKKDYISERIKIWNEYMTNPNNLIKDGYITAKNILPPMYFLFYKKYFSKIQHEINQSNGYIYTWEIPLSQIFNYNITEFCEMLLNKPLTYPEALTLFYRKNDSLRFHVDHYPHLYSCSFITNSDVSNPFSIIPLFESEYSRIDVCLNENEIILFNGIFLFNLGSLCPHFRKNINSDMVSLSCSWNEK